MASRLKCGRRCGTPRLTAIQTLGVNLHLHGIVGRLSEPVTPQHTRESMDLRGEIAKC